jgi:hypothetical protein
VKNKKVILLILLIVAAYFYLRSIKGETITTKTTNAATRSARGVGAGAGGGESIVSQNQQRIYDSSKNYVYPAAGVVRLDQNGAVAENYMQLQIFENEGQIYVKDLQFSSSLGQSANEKIYSIGYFDRDDSSTYFTQSQAQNGINITAYVGREFNVTAIWRNADKYTLVSSRTQTVYLGSNNVSTTIEGSNKMFRYPASRIFKPSRVPYFNEYISPINDTRLTVIQASNLDEKQNPVMYQNGIWGRNNVAGKIVVMVSDAWHKDRVNAATSESNFKYYFRQDVKPQILPGGKTQYIFFNNENREYWPDLALVWMKDLIDEILNENPNIKFASWTQSTFNIPAGGFVNIPGYPVADARVKSYEDIVYNSGGNWSNYVNKPNRFFDVTPGNQYPWGSVSNRNSYETGANVFGNTYGAISMFLAMQKHGYEGEFVSSIWSEYEFDMPQNLTYIRVDGVTYVLSSKCAVEPHKLYTTTAIAQHYNKWGTVDLWAEFSDSAKIFQSNNVYPFTNAKKLDAGGNLVAHVNAANNPAVTADSLAPVNHVFDSIAAMSDTGGIYSGVNDIVADVNDAGWRTGVNKYPWAAMEDKKAFVTYKPHPQTTNKILAFAYDYTNRTNKQVAFKLANGVEKVLTIEADLPTRCEITLT